MANIEVAIDLGSQYISFASPKISFVVKEPSVVAVDAVDKSVKAVGLKAVKLFNSPLSKVKVIYPILEGTIIDNDNAIILIKSLLGKLITKNALFSKIIATVIIPCGLNKKDKENIESVFNRVGVKQTRFITSVECASAQIFNEFNVARGIICDIGADKTDIAAILNGNILAGCTVYYSGKTIDKAISELMLNKYGVQVTIEQAEHIKCNCGSLYPNDISSIYAEGINVSKGLLEQVNVSARELYDIIANVMKKYCQVIESLFASVSAEAVGLLKEEGVFLCGGGAFLTGVDKYFFDTLKLNVRIPMSPNTVVIDGALRLL